MDNAPPPPLAFLLIAVLLTAYAVSVESQTHLIAQLLPPSPPPPPHYHRRSPPPPYHRRHHHKTRLPPPPPPPPRKHELNAGKKLGLLFIGIATILQIAVVGFLSYKRRQLLKVADRLHTCS